MRNAGVFEAVPFFNVCAHEEGLIMPKAHTVPAGGAMTTVVAAPPGSPPPPAVPDSQVTRVASFCSAPGSRSVAVISDPSDSSGRLAASSLFPDF